MVDIEASSMDNWNFWGSTQNIFMQQLKNFKEWLKNEISQLPNLVIERLGDPKKISC
jgi:hypothetical protein